MSLFDDLQEEQRPDADEAWRLQWHPSFDPPVKICIARNGDAKCVRSEGGWRAPVQRTLTPIEWEVWTKAISRLAPERLPSHDETMGLDGATWMLEGWTSRGDFQLHRWCPRDEVRELGLLMMLLARIEGGEVLAY